MSDVQVTCIIKPDKYSTHEHITHLGSREWLWTRERVIKSIEEQTNTFYVLDPISRKRSDVKVVYPEGRDPYVKTRADGDWNNNLLSLDQCPIR